MATITLPFKQAAKTAAAKKEKPELPGVAEIVEQGIKAKREEEAWALTRTQSTARLSELFVPLLFRTYHGRSDVEDTFQGKANAGKVTISFKNAYKLPEDLAPVRALLGDHASRFLKESFTIEIDSDSIPEHLLQQFVNKLSDMAGMMDVLNGTEIGEVGPIMGAITVKSQTKVAKAFHEERHVLFTPEQNMEIQRVMPATISARYEY